MPVKSFLEMLSTTLMNYNDNAGLDRIAKEFENEQNQYRPYSSQQKIDKKLKEAMNQ